MIYSEFEKTITQPRLNRYLNACGNDTRRAMTLYRKNLKLSQEVFTVLSCFEVALRNKIDNHYTTIHGNNWLRDAAARGGFYDTPQNYKTKLTINDTIAKLGASYTHYKLVADLGFGFWRYMFVDRQYRAAGNTLLRIFPSRPTSTPLFNYNHTFIYNELAKINNLRNRIAHHEPICFLAGAAVKETTYIRQHYNLILQLFQWMQIDEAALLYGLDHINTVCTEIDNL